MSSSWVMYGHAWSNRASPKPYLIDKELCFHSWCVCVKTKEAWDQKFKAWSYSLRTNPLLFQALVTSCFSISPCTTSTWLCCAGGCLRLQRLQRLGTCDFSGCSRGSRHWCGWWHPGYLMLVGIRKFEKSSTQYEWPTIIPYRLYYFMKNSIYYYKNQ